MPDLLDDGEAHEQPHAADDRHADRRLQEPQRGIATLVGHPLGAAAVDQVVEGGGQRLAGGVDLQLDLSRVPGHVGQPARRRRGQRVLTVALHPTGLLLDSCATREWCNGSHARLRIWCLRACGFDSRLPHAGCADGCQDRPMRGRSDSMWWGLVLEAPDPRALAVFYTRLLDWPVVEYEPDHAIVKPPQEGVFVVFQHVP